MDRKTSDCDYTESYLNGLTNTIDDYLYISSENNDEIENLTGEHPNDCGYSEFQFSS